jgi:hypothetical protein
MPNYRVNFSYEVEIHDETDEIAAQERAEEALREEFDAVGFEVFEVIVKETKAGTLVIPENDYGIPPGSYTQNQIADLLRKYKDSPEAVRFIADMIEA